MAEFEPADAQVDSGDKGVTLQQNSSRWFVLTSKMNNSTLLNPYFMVGRLVYSLLTVKFQGMGPRIRAPIINLQFRLLEGTAP